MMALDLLLLVTNIILLALLVEQRWAIYSTRCGIEELANRIETITTVDEL